MSSTPLKASRHGRYRKQLLAPQSLLPIAKNIEALFDTLDQKRLQGLLTDAEFLSYGLLTLLACRRADAFQSNNTRDSKAPVPAPPPAYFRLADFWQLLGTQGLPISSYQKILDQELSVQQFLKQVRFRGIPDSAHTALLKWMDNEYPLILLFHVPSATEVFELQKDGRRCISFFKQAGDLTAFHHDRDVISFIVHDLIHAHEFYALPQRARQQIGFYHWLDNIKNNPQLIKLQAESAEFLTCWEYVLSDMNSYCGHLLKTLNASFTIHGNPVAGDSLWAGIVDNSDLEPDEKILFRKINSASWGEADFLLLESVFEKRFRKANAYQAASHQAASHRAVQA